MLYAPAVCHEDLRSSSGNGENIESLSGMSIEARHSEQALILCQL